MVASSNRCEVFGGIVDKPLIKKFLIESGTKQFSQVLRLLDQYFRSSFFKTYVALSENNHLQTLLAWSLFDIPLSLNTPLDDNTNVNTFVNSGLITTFLLPQDAIVIKIPWLFLYQVWHVFKLFQTPTKYLSSEDAENLDCSAFCLRYFAYSRLQFRNSNNLNLSMLLPSVQGPVQNISLPVEENIAKVFPHISKKQITSKKFHSKMKEVEKFCAVRNAAFADWFLYWPKAKNIPEFLTQDWDSRIQPCKSSEVILEEYPFLICGQSKRYYKTKLTSDMISKEYKKVTTQ